MTEETRLSSVADRDAVMRTLVTTNRFVDEEGNEPYAGEVPDDRDQAADEDSE